MDPKNSNTVSWRYAKTRLGSASRMHVECGSEAVATRCSVAGCPSEKRFERDFFESSPSQRDWVSWFTEVTFPKRAGRRESSSESSQLALACHQGGWVCSEWERFREAHAQETDRQLPIAREDLDEGALLLLRGPSFPVWSHSGVVLPGAQASCQAAGRRVFNAWVRCVHQVQKHSTGPRSPEAACLASALKTLLGQPSP